MQKRKSVEIIKKLAETYPYAKPQLDFSSPYELLVAVILSAQCTDLRVNVVTSELFKIANTPSEMINLGQSRLEEIIKPCGLFHSKAKHIIESSKTIFEKYNGEVPNSVEKLMQLDGVGKKTANVVYSVAFNGDAIAVDTHVFRLARRIGFSVSTTPLGVEKDLCSLIDKNLWSKAHHYLIFHGRNVCKAIKPSCATCPISQLCEKNLK